MKSKMFAYQGMFQVWQYSVGHGRLLIRRAGSEEATQVDLLFLNVNHFDIPTILNDVSIEVIELPGNSDYKEYRIYCEYGIGKVIAGNFLFREYEGDYGDPSPLWE